MRFCEVCQKHYGENELYCPNCKKNPPKCGICGKPREDINKSLCDECDGEEDI